MTHTPGPWTIRYTTNIFGPRLNGDGVRLVANTGGYSSNVDDSVDDVNKANAYLIAAAPDLLTALKGIRSTLDDFLEDYELSVVDAVIAKAERGEG